MRIPRRVNTVLDFCSCHLWRPARAYPALGVSTAAMVVSVLVLPFRTTVAVAVASAASAYLLGWFSHTPKTVRLERDLDASEREVGRLGHLLRLSASGQATENAVETAYLPRIGGNT